ncbi:MAG: TMEM175 family protein [Flavobacteriales bacterium]|nr:TMEM175 family protein [Flavobacteriales bacterium]
MNKTRLEAFSDGIFAVIITIMVLEMKVPHEATLEAFMQLLPVFISYVVSFVVIGIYWVNHHHLFHTVKHVNTKILWANFVVLFPLTLVPFTTGWIGENYNEQLPMTIYCINLLATGIGAGILQKVLMAGLPSDDAIRLIAKRNLKKVVFSSVIYLVSIATSFFYPAFCLVLIAIVAATWFIPDKEIERVLAEEN